MPVSNSTVQWSSVAKVLHSILPHTESRLLIAKWKHFEKEKGPEWLATRLKAIWNIALLERSGESPKAIDVAFENRIHMYHQHRLVGLEGGLVHRFSRARKGSAIRRFSAALRVYTCIVLKESSAKQIEKCRVSITTPGVHLDLVPCPPEHAILAWDGIQPTNEEFEEFPSIDCLSGTSSYPTIGKIPSSVKKELPFLSLVASLGTKGVVPPSLAEFWDHRSPAMQALRKKAASFQEESDDLSYGKIVVLQEGGAKGRVICSPNAWVQLYLQPFHRKLIRVIRSVEASPGPYGLSCMFNQTKGVDLIISKRLEGQPVYCVDLSSATDRFPLFLQTHTAEKIGLPTLARAFEELKGPYVSPTGKLWSYGAGQPMGCYGSFPLFHLTHYALLQGLCVRLGLPKTGRHFAVLGDDVVIFDHALHSTYRSVLESLGVSVSEHKSFSGQVSEFAGFVVIPSSSGTGYTAFRPYKYAPHGRFSSVMNVTHALGKSVCSWGSSWAKAYELYTRTIGLRNLDLSPLIHTDEHAVGKCNLPGPKYIASLMQRLAYLVPNVYDVELDKLHIEHIMLQKHELFPGQFDREADVDLSSFSPMDYMREDLQRKRLFRDYFRDPLILAAGSSNVEL